MKETRKTYQESAEEYADSFFESALYETLIAMHIIAALENPEADENNYNVNMLLIHVKDNGILSVETACKNEYGSIYGNNDLKTLNYHIDDTCVGDFIHLYDNNRMVIYR